MLVPLYATVFNIPGEVDFSAIYGIGKPHTLQCRGKLKSVTLFSCLIMNTEIFCQEQRKTKQFFLIYLWNKENVLICPHCYIGRALPAQSLRVVTEYKSDDKVEFQISSVGRCARSSRRTFTWYHPVGSLLLRGFDYSVNSSKSQIMEQSKHIK